MKHGKICKRRCRYCPFPIFWPFAKQTPPSFSNRKLTCDDLILCQITSQNLTDSYAVAINNKDFETGVLIKPSNIRPNRIFTADQSIILSIAGHLKSIKTNQAIAKVIEILNTQWKNRDGWVVGFGAWWCCGIGRWLRSQMVKRFWCKW